MDVFGFIMLGLVIGLLIAGVGVGPIVMFLQLDPGYQLLSHPTSTKGVIIRYIICHGYSLESGRTCCAILLVALLYCKITLNSVQMISKIAKTRPVSNSLFVYSQLHCIHPIAQRVIRAGAGVLMSLGFVICVLGAWIVLMGHNLFPAELYVVLSVTMVCVYATVLETLPIAIKCHESSEHLIEILWKGQGTLELLQQACSIRKRKILKRVVRAQRPLSMYYGTAIFDKETQINFLLNVVSYTVNVILITRPKL